VRRAAAHGNRDPRAGIDFTAGALTLDINDPILGQLSLDSHGRKIRGGGAGTCGGKRGAWDTKTKFRARKVSGKVLLDGDATGKVSYKVKPCAGEHCGLPAAPAERRADG
jgi:hypothetical protein